MIQGLLLGHLGSWMIQMELVLLVLGKLAPKTWRVGSSSKSSAAGSGCWACPPKKNVASSSDEESAVDLPLVVAKKATLMGRKQATKRKGWLRDQSDRVSFQSGGF